MNYPREAMIRAARERMDANEHEYNDNDARALDAVLAIEPLIAAATRVKPVGGVGPAKPFAPDLAQDYYKP